MDSVWTILAAVGLPSAVVAGVVGLLFRRLEKRLDEEKKAREEQELARKTYEGFQVHALTAVMKLSEANAIALQNGKCNGETHKALDYLTEVRHDQRDFLIKQGLDHIF
ncbi:MAG: serine/threonine protein kinase [Oscillospiraceae bacterium]|nr:serine/threonine protein kinase [Oscillospiraceae bacterium]